MPKLSRDEFFERINKIIGDSANEESTSFIEDMTDTYNALANDNNDNDWEKKYKENDEAWRKRYQERFFSSVGNSAMPGQDREPEQEETKSIKDLFK